jgi:RNA 2',3'-cyclic 3'-phosphodiesterase
MVGLNRVFVAVSPPEGVRLAMADRLSAQRPPGKTAPPQNWHITLRFLGRIDTLTYERFLSAMDQCDLAEPFTLRLGRLGAFPTPARATVLWVGVTEGADRLEQLASIADECAQVAGLTPEDRPFHPHLTLSRIRPPQDVTVLIDQSVDMGIGWRCDELVVYQSHLGGGAPRYEPLETLPLLP